jgi:hypothetical protein
MIDELEIEEISYERSDVRFNFGFTIKEDIVTKYKNNTADIFKAMGGKKIH